MKNVRILTYLFAFLFLASCSEASSQVKNMGLDEFVTTYKNTEGALLLDVRTPREWQNGVLENSAKVDYNGGNFAKNIESLDKEKPLFVYCAVGGRSSRASRILEKKGFKVYNLTRAGYAQLKSKGL